MPRGARYAEMEAQFARGKVAMMISGPWAWDNVRKVGIDFGVAPIPAVAGQPAKPFVGVLGCMVSAPSKLKDVAREFLENHLLQVEQPEDRVCRRAAGHAGQQGLLRRAASRPNDPRHHGQRPRR
jgi:maltose-binding protein MalE